MWRARRLAMGLMALGAALGVSLPAEAKGPPDLVTITGPGIAGEIRVTAAEELLAFSFYQFNDLGRRIEAPEGDLGRGFRITRWIHNTGRSGLKEWDYLTYYPNPDGGLGYLFFDGLDPAIGSTQGQGEWYRPSVDGDAAMKRLLARASDDRARAGRTKTNDGRRRTEDDCRRPTADRHGRRPGGWRGARPMPC